MSEIRKMLQVYISCFSSVCESSTGHLSFFSLQLEDRFGRNFYDERFLLMSTVKKTSRMLCGLDSILRRSGWSRLCRD